MITLLVDNNKDINFYILSDSDLSDTFTVDNLYIHNNEDLDIVYVVTGLGEYEKDEVLIDKLNTLYSNGVEFKFLNEDPRCLESMNNDERMKFIPSVIITQTNDVIKYKGYRVEMLYVPIEKAICYKYDMKEHVDKDKTIIAIANTAGGRYNRIKILSRIIGNSIIPVYGRLSEEEQKMFCNYKGELKYDLMMKELQLAVSTIIIPIRRGWVTSKYVEALMYDVFPIFYKDYNVKLLDMYRYNPVIVENHDDFYDKLLSNITPIKKEALLERVKVWKDLEVKPFVSGKLLSEQILEV